MPTIGHGEYELPGLRLSRFELRRKFLGTVVDIEPQVLSTLRAVYEDVQDQPQSWHYPAIPPGLHQWGQRWHLAYDWCYGWVRERFEEWTAQREERPVQQRWDTETVESFLERWLGAGGTLAIPAKEPNPSVDNWPHLSNAYTGEIEPLRIRIRWNVFNETEAAFRERATRDFHEQIKAYVERAKAAALAASVVATLAKNAQELEEHLTWLARVVIQGESPTGIWQSTVGDGRGRPRGRKKNGERPPDRTYDAFRKAIRRTADLIGVNLPYGREASR